MLKIKVLRKINFTGSIIFLTFILQIGACKKYSPCADKNPNRYYLDTNNLKQNPYHSKNFDSLVYISDNNDTLILICTTRNKNEWVGSDYIFLSPDCGGKTAQTYHQANYIVYNKSINTISRFFMVNHTKQGFTGFDESENKNLNNTIWFSFNNLNFFISAFEISNPSYISYIQKSTFNNREFTELTWKHPSDSSLGKAYFNKEFGLVHIVDNRTAKKWTLYHAE